jgi:hypothetical protein
MSSTTLSVLTQNAEEEIKRLNAQSHEPTSSDILAVTQLLVEMIKESNKPADKEVS